MRWTATPWAAVFLLLLHTSSGVAAPGNNSETGDLHRSYVLEETHERVQYRLYVSKSYDGSRAYPVVVAREAAAQVDKLPAASRPGARPPKGMIRPRAEAPPSKPDDYAERKPNGLTDPCVSLLPERDYPDVLAPVRQEYRVDPARFYLTGNSMGAGGTAYLAARYPAARYPEIWAAIAPSGGPFAAWSDPYFQLRDHHIAALFVHGDRDEYSHWSWFEAIVKRAQREGVEAQLLVVPGGNHVEA